MNTKIKPVHEVRLGSVRAAIWKNESHGVVRFNTTVTRLYKDGDAWKSSDSFGREELLLLAKVADQAHSWIHAQAHAESQP
jgi:hypothetical protein